MKTDSRYLVSVQKELPKLSPKQKAKTAAVAELPVGAIFYPLDGL
jgi:hypothetical protein